MIRGALELLGVVAFFGFHFGILWWVYLIGSDLGVAKSLYWSAIVLGYIGMMFVAVFRRRAFRGGILTRDTRCLAARIPCGYRRVTAAPQREVAPEIPRLGCPRRGSRGW